MGDIERGMRKGERKRVKEKERERVVLRDGENVSSMERDKGKHDVERGREKERKREN